ncbi:hypothetical protein ACP70R_043356 [Stipagrostis hirtigluma subsp. patula]
MLRATQPLGAILTPSHGSSSFTSSTASSGRMAAPVPRRRRRSIHRTASKVRCSISSPPTETNGEAVGTVTFHGLTTRHAVEEKPITMKATVTVHLGNIFSHPIYAVVDFFRRDWLSLELVSSELDPNTGKEWTCHCQSFATSAGDPNDNEFTHAYTATFKVPATFGPVGAVRVVNHHHTEMKLGDIKVFVDGDESSAVKFHCDSWIHPNANNSKDKRVFFPLKSYLPSQTPKGLKDLRKEELNAIRGDGNGRRAASDRIYDYDVYNDLGDPDHDLKTKRPVLGGSDKYPYPRRCRTGRNRSKTDPMSEERGKDIYVPRDEAFTERKQKDFQLHYLFSVLHACRYKLPEEQKTRSFPSLASIEAMFKDGHTNQPDEMGSIMSILKEELPNACDFEMPEIHAKDKFAWFRDEEFARQTLAGMNPLSIQLVTEFPIASKLSEEIYGEQDSLLTKEVIEKQINGVMTAEEAVKNKRLFMLDYHDLLLPYVHKVRMLGDTTLYGSRTLFFLTDDGTLRPIAIELTRPKSPTKPQWREVFTPGMDGSVTGSWLWQLAKTHVLAHDTGYHQLVSHWLRTHCCVEPYIIAANRQLSQMHPIYRLLHPHFRFTMEINALARQKLINAGGIIESTFSPGEYCMELSSAAYGSSWRFDMEALPADLIRRGMAVQGEDGKLELSIEDYPYANDGLLVWDSLKEWASDYVAHYYPCAADIVGDEELQGWWTEVRTKGHEDKKDEEWWPKLDSHESLVQVLTTIMWVTSGHHAAVNFGQYPFGGYFPNRPTTARRNMPNEPSREGMGNFIKDPEKVLLDTFPSQYQATMVLQILDVLSSHSPDEEYMGTHEEPAWLAEGEIKLAFGRFRRRMLDIVEVINEWNEDPKRKNRNGAGVMKYVLLKPSDGSPMDEKTVMAMGIPNSISI